MDAAGGAAAAAAAGGVEAARRRRRGQAGGGRASVATRLARAPRSAPCPCVRASRCELVLCDYTTDTMVVLEGGGALMEPALALDGATAACLERAYAQQDVSLKLLPKRYINLHQWLSPVTSSTSAAAGKDLKLQIVSILI